jgi:hypothetical protein
MPSGRLLTPLLIALVLGGLLWGVFGFILPGQGPVLQEWETHNSKFKIRVQRRHDLYGLMTYWYVFQCAENGSIVWHEVMRQLHGEPVALPKDQIRFVSENVAFIFFQLKYAVTVDGGKTWAVFDFGNNASFKPEQLDYSRIADVDMRADGVGTLTMFRYDSRKGTAPLFITSDYGKHWVAKVVDTQRANSAGFGLGIFNVTTQETTSF